MKKNLTKKRNPKNAGTFIRLDKELKKSAQIYAIKNGMTLTQLITKALQKELAL